MDEAKKMFLKYEGSYYQMLRDEVYDQYKNYNVSKSIEKEWFEEMLTDLRKRIEDEKNKKNLTDYFGRYLSIAVRTKNKDALQYAMTLLRVQKAFLDSNSLFLWINIILNSRSLEDDLLLRQELIEKMLNLLKELLIKPITISEDYKENGEYPDYLTEEILLKKIQNKITYWEKY